MADEIKVSSYFQRTKTGLSFNSPSRTFRDDQAGDGVYSAEITLLHTAASILTSMLTTDGWCCIENLDPTNYIVFGPYTGGTLYPVGQVPAGGHVVFKLDPTYTLGYQANSASCDVRITVLDA